MKTADYIILVSDTNLSSAELKQRLDALDIDYRLLSESARWEVITGPVVMPEPVIEPPVVVVPPAGPGVVGEVVAVTGVAFSFIIPALVFSNYPTSADVSDLPAGLRYDSSAREIHGMPTQAGSWALTLSGLVNGVLEQHKLQLTILEAAGAIPAPVRPDVITTPPVIETKPTPSGDPFDEPFTFAGVNVSDAPSTDPNFLNLKATVKNGELVVEELAKEPGRYLYNNLGWYTKEQIEARTYPLGREHNFQKHALDTPAGHLRSDYIRNAEQRITFL
jgi:hypothetical protein